MNFLAARPGFGFANPNVAGAFFVLLAVGVWMFSAQGWRFWLCLMVWGGLTGLVVLTASRGSLVALAGGLFAIWGASRFPRPSRLQAMGMLVALISLGVLSVTGRMGERLAQSSWQDGSVAARTEILGRVPAMMVSAPRGWGWGKAAEAYQNWFQSAEDFRAYKHLVSMHATWLVEMGWLGRWAYVTGWLIVLVVCFQSPAAFGVWVALGLAGVFSHVGENPLLWGLPVAGCGVALARRIHSGIWPSKLTWGLCVSTSFCLLGIVAVVGALSARPVHWNGRLLTMGESRPEVWYYCPSPGVLGRAFGKSLLRNGAVGVAWDPDALADARPRCVVLSGRTGELPKRIRPEVVVWLNPPANLSNAEKAWLKNAGRREFHWGELRTDGNASELREWVETQGGTWHEVTGSGLLLISLPHPSLMLP